MCRQRELIERAKWEWESTVDSLSQLVCLFDRQGRILRANRTIERWGLGKVTNVQGRDVHALLHPDCDDPACYLTTFLSQAWDQVAQGCSLQCEMDDPIVGRYLSIQIRPVLERPTGERDDRRVAQAADSLAVGVIQDITERQRADQALRDSERKFRSIVEWSQDGIVLSDEQGRIVEWNRGQEEIAALTREEVMGQLVYDVQFQMAVEEARTPEAYEHIRTSMNRFLETGEAPWLNTLQEIPIQRPDGSRRIIQQIAFPIHTDHGVMMGSIARDVTEIKQVEETLRASEAYIRELFDSSLDMIISVDTERRIVEFNQAAERAFGYRREEMIGEHMGLLYADPQEGVEIHKAVMREGHCEREAFGRRKDGSLFLGFLSASALHNAEGEIVGFMGMVRDITERKRAERVLQLNEARLGALWTLSQMTVASVKQMADFVLEKAVALTRSEIGFIGFVNDQNDKLDIHSWSLHAMEQCAVVDRPFHFPIIEAGIWAEAVRRREPFIVNDYAAPHPAKKGYPDGHVALRRLVSIPVFDGDRIVAVLAVANKEDGYDDSDVRQLSLLGGGMWQLIQRQQAEAALRRSNRELSLLSRAGQAFLSSLDLDDVLGTVLGQVRRLLDVVACSIWLIDPETDELVCRQATGRRSEQVRGWRLAPGQGIGGWVVRTGESLIVADAQVDERYFDEVEQCAELALRSILTVPLKFREEIIGLLQAVDTRVGRFTAVDLGLLESLAASAAMAIENARLYAQARQDAETKSTLLREVNHRVKNNLTAIVGLLYAERRHAGLENQAVYQAILQDLINRVQGLATVHSMLSASEWAPLLLSELIEQVTQSTLETLPQGHRVLVTVPTSTVRVTPDQARDLALVINELTTNVVKHALDDRAGVQMTASITRQEEQIVLNLRDNGPGYPDHVLQREGYSVGLDLVHAIGRRNLQGNVSLSNEGGAVIRIAFRAMV